MAISDATDLVFLRADGAIAQGLIPDARPLTAPVTPETLLTALVEAPVAVVSGHAMHSVTEGGAWPWMEYQSTLTILRRE